jgi:RND superfamily putative drug exporter
LDAMGAFVSRRPVWVVAIWLALAVAVGVVAPDLTKLAAEGQAKMLATDAESRQAAELVKQSWPGEAYESMAVAVLHRPAGLTDADREFAIRLSRRFAECTRAGVVVRVLGPASIPEIAGRMVSRDGTISLVAVSLATSFVAPVTQEVVAWLDREACSPALAVPAGLELRWTGDAVIGRDYMANVQTSLDRAAVATVVLLLIVLLAVYRSVWLALVPLVTIGVSLVISRGLLAWMILGGWEVSSLVELFLIAILFGTGTDFCLFLSWRYAEHLNASNPTGSMRLTLARSLSALVTSAGTIIIGLLLMGTTRFKLFSSTGPSVALGLALALAATLTLTPALLVLLARLHPRSFDGLAGSSRGFWERLGRRAMARPLRSWVYTVLAMLPLSILGLKTHFIQDLMTELPATSRSAQDFRLVASKFESGMLAPLTVILESDADLSKSEGLALIDDVSRLLSHQRQLIEVRSATQPLGTTQPLDQARLASRLGEVNAGFKKLVDGAAKLHKGLTEGAAKLRMVMWLEAKTGLKISGRPGDRRLPKTDLSVARTHADSAEAVEKPEDVLLRDLTRAAGGAAQIADGAGRASREVTGILNDPVGHRALDHLLINDQTVHDHPELKRSFAAYITPDGHRARIDLTQSHRMFSHDAMDQVVTLRRRLNDYLGEYDGLHVTARVAGANAESADIRELTYNDQVQSWFVVPIGVFLVLILALRDPLACFNLVATMVLTYAFALGATHLVFVNLLGAEGLDWKVPYFLFVLLIAVGVDYNVFLMARLNEESQKRGLRDGIIRAIGQTGGLISSAALITASSFASFLFSPLGSLRQLGFALVVGILVDAVLVRPLLVPCGHWLLKQTREALSPHIVVRRGKREYAVLPD